MALLNKNEPLYFQSFYRISSWEFGEYALDHSDKAVFVRDKEHKFSVLFRLEKDGDEQCLLIQSFLFVDTLDEAIERVLSGQEQLQWETEASNSKYVDALMKMQKKMDAMTSDVLGNIRWRIGICGGPASVSTEWWMLRWQNSFPSADDGSYVKHRMFLENMVEYGPMRLGMPKISRVIPRGNEILDIENLLKNKCEQPVYHDLFRQALNSLPSNSKSAVVMCIAALETSLKTAIRQLNVHWKTVLNRRKRSLRELLIIEVKNLRPKNQANESMMLLPEKVEKSILSGIKLRNSIAHGDCVEVSEADALVLVMNVRDVIYLMDYYMGKTWALDLVSKDTLNSMIGNSGNQNGHR